MSNSKVNEGWKDTKEKIKRKFSMLSVSDQFLIEGRKEEVLTRLQLKLGISREQLQKIISDL